MTKQHGSPEQEQDHSLERQDQVQTAGTTTVQVSLKRPSGGRRERPEPLVYDGQLPDTEVERLVAAAFPDRDVVVESIDRAGPPSVRLT